MRLGRIVEGDNSISCGVQKSRFDPNLILVPAQRPPGISFLLAFLESGADTGLSLGIKAGRRGTLAL